MAIAHDPAFVPAPAPAPAASAPPSAPLPRFRGHPVFGSLLDFRRDRGGMQLRIAKACPEAARLRMGFFQAVMLNSPALAHEMFQAKASSFVKAPGLSVFLRPLLGKGLLTSEEKFHAAQRKLLAPAFAHKRIASYADTMAERAARYAASLADGARVDAAENLMQLTLEIVGKTLFDAEVAGAAHTVGEAVTTVMETVIDQIESLVPIPPFVPTKANRRNRRAIDRLDAIVYEMIRARRREGGDRGDLLSMLLAAQHDDGTGMSDKQIRDEAMTLLLAGHETTANALAWTFYLLGRHPEARARVEAEIDHVLAGRVPSYGDLERLPYTLAVLKEAMRLYPPAYILARRAIEPVSLGEHHFSKNTLVFVNVLGIHRRADSFPEPEAFRPERFLGDAEKKLPRGAYIPFGGGPRVCIGNHFALMEGHVLLATILGQLRFDLAFPDREIALEPLVTLRPRGGVPMIVTRRKAASQAA